MVRISGATSLHTPSTLAPLYVSSRCNLAVEKRSGAADTGFYRLAFEQPSVIECARGHSNWRCGHECLNVLHIRESQCGKPRSATRASESISCLEFLPTKSDAATVAQLVVSQPICHSKISPPVFVDSERSSSCQSAFPLEVTESHVYRIVSVHW